MGLSGVVEPKTVSELKARPPQPQAEQDNPFLAWLAMLGLMSPKKEERKIKQIFIFIASLRGEGPGSLGSPSTVTGWHLGMLGAPCASPAAALFSRAEAALPPQKLCQGQQRAAQGVCVAQSCAVGWKSTAIITQPLLRAFNEH